NAVLALSRDDLWSVFGALPPSVVTYFKKNFSKIRQLHNDAISEYLVTYGYPAIDFNHDLIAVDDHNRPSDQSKLKLKLADYLADAYGQDDSKRPKVDRNFAFGESAYAKTHPLECKPYIVVPLELRHYRTRQNWEGLKDIFKTLVAEVDEL